MANLTQKQNKVYRHDDVTAIILAGGLGTRLNNQNKGLISLGGKTLLAHVIERLTTQTSHIVISANQNLTEYRQSGYPVVADTVENHQGPLAGILSCQIKIQTPLVMTVPCDAPLLPLNLLETLLHSYNEKTVSQLCVAHDGHQLQNLFMLFSIERFSHLTHFFEQGHRKVGNWIQSQPHSQVYFSDQTLQFTNINTEESLSKLRNEI
ncbi:MAG: molybdenum cofactor guanylyltransferase [Thiomicrorhabdus sp.]|nr:molybdenum cofactor guanylyltransferase [Thiomicrorhabdus sp.]